MSNTRLDSRVHCGVIWIIMEDNGGNPQEVVKGKTVNIVPNNFYTLYVSHAVSRS